MSPTELREKHTVSAKLMAGEEAEAIADAVLSSNAAAVVEDHGAYLVIEAERELVFDMEDIALELGRPYDVAAFQVVLSSYTGEVDVQDRQVLIREAMSG